MGRRAASQETRAHSWAALCCEGSGDSAAGKKSRLVTRLVTPSLPHYSLDHLG